MRYGFTTGSCAAAAAKAAAFMLLTGTKKTKITIETPKGIPYTAELLDITRKEREVSCAVKKDGGDDPDITSGALIYAGVSFSTVSEPRIMIDGGIGVGRVTKPGLDQPIGNAAINHVPREMIEKEVKEVQKDIKQTVKEMDVTGDIRDAVNDARKEVNDLSRDMKQDFRQLDKSLSSEMKTLDDELKAVDAEVDAAAQSIQDK